MCTESLRNVYKIITFFIVFLSVIEFMITNNSGQTLMVSSAKPKMGTWEKALDSQLANNGKTKGTVSDVHVCCKHTLHNMYVMHTQTSILAQQ